MLALHTYTCLVTDIDECDRRTDTCDEQLCRNTVPDFECYCLRGYAKDVSTSGGSTTNVCVGEYHPPEVHALGHSYTNNSIHDHIGQVCE